MSRMIDRLLKESTAPCEHAPQYVQVLRHASVRRSRKMGAYPNAPDMHLCKAGCLFLLILLLLPRLSASFDVRRNTTSVLGFTHQNSAHRLPGSIARSRAAIPRRFLCPIKRPHLHLAVITNSVSPWIVPEYARRRAIILQRLSPYLPDRLRIRSRKRLRALRSPIRVCEASY
jgi:hypothetical protein